MTIPVRRRVVAWLLATIGPLVLVAVFLPFRDDEGLPGVLPAFVALVVAVAFTGGTPPALVAAGVGFTAGNAALTRPYGTLRMNELHSVVGLTSFLAVGVAAAVVVGRLGVRTAQALRARAQAEALAASAATLVADNPLPELLDQVRILVGLEAVALEDADGNRVAVAGEPSTLGGAERIDLVEDFVLVTSRDIVDAEDRLVLRAFGDQLVAAQQRAELSRGVARAETLAEVDRFRTALLRAVSHDLRTPLSSIKAAASSLQQDDVEWPPDARAEFLSTIIEEGDRLDRIVANLLDASRLESGILSVHLGPVGLDTVAQRVASAVGEHERLRIEVDPEIPAALADRGLLERVVENLLANAVRHTPPGTPIEVTGERGVDDATGDTTVSLYIVDHGPGIAEDDHQTVFRAFGRVGDDVAGVGLGLAVAQGFVEAMGGEIVPSTTPGGGLTMEIRLRSAVRDGGRADQ